MAHTSLPVTFRLIHDPPPMPEALSGCVVAIGNFDGVHRGHRGVIERAMALAQALHRPCAVLTFEPHPSDFFAHKSVIFRLTPEAAKAECLRRLGLEGMIVLSFDESLAALPAEDFVRDVLVGRLGISAVVSGYDFHFGQRRGGTPAFLQEAGSRYGFAVEIVERIAQDGEGSLDAVSSTATRDALARGDVAGARALLGHEYFILGPVQHGKKIGRTLGFPTANIALDPSCRLAPGIYAVRVHFSGGDFGGVASYGHRPTFDNGAALLEVMLFDFFGDLYGQTLEVAFVDWLRPELKFDGVDALVEQMGRDVAQARAVLAV